MLTTIMLVLTSALCVTEIGVKHAGVAMNCLTIPLLLVVLAVPCIADVEWIRPTGNSAKPIWGVKGGIVFAIWPGALGSGGKGGPRGLIRVGYESNGEMQLINFVAVEPVVRGKGKGFSELEWSQLDSQRGKRLWASSSSDETEAAATPPAGQITRPEDLDRDVEQLRVVIHIEKFQNGAHPYVVVSIRSDRPNEISLAVFHKGDSAPMQTCALTATMGNYERLRYLWLKDRIVDSRILYEGYNGTGFVEKESYGLKDLFKNKDGDVIVAATTDEDDPRATPASPQKLVWWNYKAYKVTQYWKKYKGSFKPDLHLRVNGRKCYWASKLLIPNGIAFENFELREAYYPGQKFWFGLTRRRPEDMGFGKVGK